MRFTITRKKTDHKNIGSSINDSKIIRKKIIKDDETSEKEKKEEEKEETLSTADINALKDLVKSIPDLLELLKKPSEEKSDDDESNSVLLESNESETEETEETDKDEVEEDDGIIEDEDFDQYFDETNLSDSAVSIEKQKKSNDMDVEDEISKYFDSYYTKQLRK